MHTDYMAIDQNGQTYHSLGNHPRKELLARFGRKSAQKLYRDTKNGTVHVGWIIAGLWLSVYEVVPMQKAA